jgi:hypothetical protein
MAYAEGFRVVTLTKDEDWHKTHKEQKTNTAE